MQNAAERLLGLRMSEIQDLAKDINVNKALALVKENADVTVKTAE